MHRHRIAVLAAAAIALLALAATASARIAYTTTAGALKLAGDDGRNAVPLGARGSWPLISPDGTRVAYIGGTDAVPQLRIRTIETGAEVRVVGMPSVSSGYEVVWSPDSARLVMPTDSATRDGYLTGIGFSVVDVATGVATPIVTPRGNDLGGYSWAPTSDRLVYGVQRYGGALNRTTMRIVGVDGTPIATLGIGSNPLWGPTRIAFQRFTEVRWHGMRLQHGQLWTIDPNGPGTPRQLTRYPSVGMVYGPFALLWSPDGSTLYGGIGGEDLSMPGRIDAVTGRFTRLKDGAGQPLEDASPVAISADGRTLLLDTGIISGAGVFKTMPAADGRTRVFLRQAYNLSVSAGWQP